MKLKNILILLFVLIVYVKGEAQFFPTNQTESDSIYAINIKLSKIKGVYIPSNLNEAFDRLNKLTPESAIANFKNAEEIEVCKKLHFGIGRWMIINWSFYEGSRLSHYLKQKGLFHPDDMAQFILRTYHRSLLNKDLDEKEIIDELVKARKKEVQYLINN